MNFQAISGLINFISGLLCSILIGLSRPKNILKSTWSLFSLSIALWGFGYFKAFSTNNGPEALFWGRFLNLSAISIPIFFFHFVLLLSNRIKEKKKELLIYYCIIFSYLFIAVIFPNLFVKEMSAIGGFEHYPKAGILYYAFPLLFGFLVFYGNILLLLEYKKTSLLKKTQYKYVFWGSVIGFSGGSTCFPMVFGIKIYPFAVFLVTVYVGMITYATLKYRLMDIKLAITRLSIFIKARRAEYHGLARG